MKPEGRVQWLSIVILAVLGASLMSESWIEKIDRLEAQWFSSYLGPQRYSALQDTVQREFPYPEKVSFDHSFPGTAVASPELAIAYDWLNCRLVLLQKAAHRIMQRLCLLELFTPLGLLGISLFAIDAAVVRQIRQHSFDYSSPLIHRTSLQALSFLIFLLIILISVPLPLPPQLILIHLSLVCWVLWLNISHMPKRI
jgi:hypothetical protein